MPTPARDALLTKTRGPFVVVEEASEVFENDGEVDELGGLGSGLPEPEVPGCAWGRGI